MPAHLRHDGDEAIFVSYAVGSFTLGSFRMHLEPEERKGGEEVRNASQGKGGKAGNATSRDDHDIEIEATEASRRVTPRRRWVSGRTSAPRSRRIRQQTKLPTVAA